MGGEGKEKRRRREVEEEEEGRRGGGEGAYPIIITSVILRHINMVQWYCVQFVLFNVQSTVYSCTEDSVQVY